ncbi:FISUMP domain-containing protein [Fibrella forsythiae]|uniref:Fibrobacter succinogenes major paralogous domain-containing protein n=1 Tax=Fibrella forsythiae TaxID=2817061 RepID=A0ABS3JR75_9BACT|nr:FISUMP domain-containing protein [Fibrella forsythiae]MBO0952515.1 hypothetical protein [Fibrella forsythiae]
MHTTLLGFGQKSALRYLLLGVMTSISLSCTRSAGSTDPKPAPPLSPDSVRINGHTYPTRLIGSQRWTTINYRGSGGMAYGTGTEKPIYGRYYTYAEINAITLPVGWRLPTEADWVTLVQSQGVVLEQNTARKQEAVKKLLSTTNWRSLPGTNASGFDAHPAGYSTNNSPPQDGDIAEFWATGGVSMSIQESSQSNHLLRFYSNDNDPSVRYTVRFVSSQ